MYIEVSSTRAQTSKTRKQIDRTFRFNKTKEKWNNAILKIQIKRHFQKEITDYYGITDITESDEVQKHI
jgi:hypothetical protein